jgi:uncharacterized protein with HEPN domain
MSSKNPAQRLRDIAENIEAIREFTSGMDVGVFLASRTTIYAVTRALEIISEASRRLPDEFKTRYPDLDWTAIAAVGNLYRHEYENVDDVLVWHTAKHSLDILDAAVRAELESLGDLGG